MRKVLMAVLLVMGCSDGGDLDMGGPDMSVADMTIPADMRIPIVVNGTKLLDGRQSLVGITTDDFVVAADSTNLVQVVSIAGGTPEPMATMAGDARISGKAAFAWSEVDQGTGVGTLKLWTNANKVQTLGTASTIATNNATADGAFVMFTDNADANGDLADIFVAGSDGNNKLMVLPQRLAFMPCRPRIGLAGQKFVVAHCLPAGDAGATPATVSLVDPTNGNVTLLVGGVRPFVSVSKPGTHVLVISDPGNLLSVVTIAGAVSQQIDALPVSEAYFNNAGTEVFYRTMGGVIKRSAIVSPAPAQIGGSGATGIDGISPDEQWIVYHKAQDQQGVGDLFIASTTPPGTPTTIAVADVALFGDVFTADSSRLLYYSDLDEDLAGTLNAHPVAGGAAQVISDKKVWLSYSSASGKIVYNDNWRNIMMAGRADLKVSDGTGGTNLISVQADDGIGLNPAKTKVVYGYRVDTSKTGLYVAPAE